MNLFHSHQTCCWLHFGETGLCSSIGLFKHCIGLCVNVGLREHSVGLREHVCEHCIGLREQSIIVWPFVTLDMLFAALREM